MPRSRILYLNHTATVSGAENSLLQLLAGLDRERFEPLVVLPESGRFERRLEDAGIATHIVSLAVPNKLDPWGSWRNLRRLRRIVRDERVALIHANSFHAVKYVAPLHALTRLPTVASVRDIVPFTRLTRRIVLSCDRVACVSHATARNLLGRDSDPAGGRVRVVYNGVDPGAPVGEVEREALRAELGLAGAPGPLVGMVAPLVPWKGQPVFLDAARRATATTGAGSYVLAGDATFSGPDYVETLRRLASVPELEGRVHMVGFREDVPALLSLLDVVVCASVEPDPLPRAVLEAMAAARPVVGSRIGGIPEAIVHGETGLLVEPGRPDELADGLVALFGDEPLRRELGRAGARRVAERFTAARHCRAVEALYDELLGGA